MDCARIEPKKTRSCSRLDSWIVHGLEMLDWWIAPGLSPKNEELFRMGLVDRRRMGGVRLVDRARVEP